MTSNSWVLIPAHNEESSIADVLRQVRRCSHLPILVVDSCSTDRTSTIASQYAERVIRTERVGYWHALQTGYQYLVTEYDVHALVQLDSDGQHDPIHIPKLLHHLSKYQQSTWVWGSRYQTGTVSEGVLALGQRIFCSGLQWYFGSSVHDVSSGFWAINRPVIDAFLHYNPSRQTADVTLRGFALQQGITCIELPVAMKPREAGISMHVGVTHRLKHVRDVVLDSRQIWWN